MRKSRLLVVGFSILLVAAVTDVQADASPRGEATDGGPVVMQGTLRLVGNEPFTHLSLKVADDHDYLLMLDDSKPYRDMVGRMVTVVGTVATRTVTSADNKYHITEHIITDISSIKLVEK